MSESGAGSTQAAIALVTAALSGGETIDNALASEIFNQYATESGGIERIVSGFIQLSTVLLAQIEHLNDIPPAETLQWVAEVMAMVDEDE